MERVGVVTRGSRRDYTVEEKAVFLAEAAEPEARVLPMISGTGVSPSLINRWRREAEGRPVQHEATSGVGRRCGKRCPDRNSCSRSRRSSRGLTLDLNHHSQAASLQRDG